MLYVVFRIRYLATICRLLSSRLGKGEVRVPRDCFQIQSQHTFSIGLRSVNFIKNIYNPGIFLTVILCSKITTSIPNRNNTLCKPVSALQTQHITGLPELLQTLCKHPQGFDPFLSWYQNFHYFQKCRIKLWFAGCGPPFSLVCKVLHNNTSSHLYNLNYFGICGKKICCSPRSVKNLLAYLLK